MTNNRKLIWFVEMKLNTAFCFANMKSGKLQINELTTILNEHFQWNKARVG
jgi:hypothetical protein